MHIIHLFTCFLFGLGLWSCNTSTTKTPDVPSVALVVLGTAQDAGYPHIGCYKSCCTQVSRDQHAVVSLGVIDQLEKKYWLFEATPNIPEQIKALQDLSDSTMLMPSGIALTHAHIGHYTGLMYLGKEALGGQNTPVMCLPKMQEFLTNNGPWSQLVNDSNIVLHPLIANKDTALSKRLTIHPFTVPHRDEYSETAGFFITGPSKTALFIPDIDKWHRWAIDLKSIIAQVDYAFLDGTFYNEHELPHRNIEEIPHPLVKETMELLKELPSNEKCKVHFIHFNHTNPLFQPASEASKEVLANGFNIARKGDIFDLQ